MANNQIRVSLLLNADTKSAQNSLNQLGASLAKISNAKIGVQNGPIQQAAQSARELEIHLSKAMNANTGKLDLGKFTASLQQSGQSLSTLTSRLTSIGPQGQQAFVQLANSIARAQMPATQLSGAITKVLKTFGSAALWRMAYGGINAVSKSFKDAVGYVKNFDKALTDIAIVSDMTDKQLARFAKSASASAKELKTTAVEYSKAALIFYQQGLDSAEVAERTEATIKMAHVTGESAKTVSDQLTAIWNNFDDGSKSLEYYADVITALGAATASSSQEIAEGLEKFAAIAETVGLSYEYATTALATVTAETRQSADVVGTAFKTLFARIQDLELGKTLEDGVTLGQYSEALDAIGVSVLKSNGELRDMDSILNDLGEQWDYISDAQKVAVAQTVGGTRQYAQLMALMDNWDTFEINLAIAEGSEGTLDKQDERWKKSAEAAAAEVDQAWENLYSKLLNSDLVVGFTSGLADVINTIGGVIDAFGGIGPVILTIAGLFSNSLMPIIMQAANGLRHNFRVAFGFAAKDAKNFVSDFQSEVERLASEGYLNKSYAEQARLAGELLETKAALERASASVTEQELKELEARYKIIEALTDQVQGYHQAKDAAEQEANAARDAFSSGKGAKDLTDAAREYADQKANEEFNYDEEIKKNKELKQKEIAKREKIKAQLENRELTDEEKQSVQKTINEADAKLESYEEKNKKITTDLGRASEAKLEAENRKKAAKEKLKSEDLTIDQRARYEKQLANATAEIKKQDEAIQEANRKLGENKTAMSEIRQTRKSAQGSLEKKPLSEQEKADLEAKLAKSDERIEKLNHENRSLNTKKGNITKANKVMSLNANEKIVGRAELDLDTEARISSRTIGEKFDRNIIQKQWDKLGAKGKNASVSLEFSAESFEEQVKEQIKYKEVIEDSSLALKELQMLQEKGERLAKNDESFKVYEEAAQEADDLEAQKKEAEKKLKENQNKLEKGGLSDEQKANVEAKIAESNEIIRQSEEKLVIAQQKRQKALDGLSAEGKEYLADLDAQKGKFNELTQTLGYTEEELKELGITFDNFETMSANDQIALLQKRFGEIKNGADLVDGALEELLNEMINVLKGKGIDTSGLEKLKTKLNEEAEAARNAKRSQQELDAQREKFNQKLNVSTDSFANAIGTIGQYAGSIMSAVSAFKMFIDAFREGASPMERITGILMGLSMLLPIVSQAFKIMNDEQAKGQLIDLLNVISGKARLKVTKEQTKANIEEAKSQDKVNKEVNENTASDALNTAGDKAGGKGAGSAAGSLRSAFIGALPALAAVAAAIAIVVGTVKIAKGQLAKYEEAADRAQQQSENLTEAYKQAEAEQNTFNNSLDKYDSAVEKTKNLAKGTAEYAEALNEANSAALELIQNYDDLQYSIVDGVITLDENSRKLAAQKQRDKVANAQAAQLIGQNTAGYANSQQQQAEFARETLQSIRGDLTNAANIGVTTAAGAAAGALIGSVIPAIGTAIGAAVGAAIGAIGGAIAVAVNGSRTDVEEKALDDIAAYIKKTGDQTVFKDDAAFEKFLKAELKIDDQRLVNSLIKNREAVEKLTAAEVARLRKEETSWKLALNASQQSNAIFTNSDFQDFILNSSANTRSEAEEEAGKRFDNMSKSEKNEAYLNTMFGADADKYKIDGDELKKLSEDGATWVDAGEVDKDLMRRSYVQKSSVDAVSNTDIYQLNKEAEKLAAQLEASGIETVGAQRKILAAYAESNKETVSLANMSKEEVKKLEEGLGSIQDGQLRGALTSGIENYWNNLPKVFNTNAFDDWYNQLSDEDKAFVWTMDIDENATMENVKTLFDQIREYSKGQTLNLTFTANNAIADELKKGGRFTLDENGQYTDNILNILKNSGATEDTFKLFGGATTVEEAAEYAKNLTSAEIIDLLNGNQDSVLSQNFALTEGAIQGKRGQVKDLEQQSQEADTKVEDATYRVIEAEGGLKDVEGYYREQLINGIKNAYVQTLMSSNPNLRPEQAQAQTAIDFQGIETWSLEELQGAHAYQSYGAWSKEDEAKLQNAKNMVEAQKGVLDQSKADLDTATSEAATTKTTLDTEQENLEKLETDQTMVLVENLKLQSEALGINVEEMDDYAASLKSSAKNSDRLADSLAEDQAALHQVAQYAMRLNKGVQALNENYDDWIQDLSAPRTSQVYQQSIGNFKTAVGDLLDVESQLVSENFILEHLEDIQKAAKGEADAIERIREAYAKDITLQIIGKSNFEQVQNEFNTLYNWASTYNLEVGAYIDNETFLAQAQALIDTGAYTADKLVQIFEGMGYAVQLAEDKYGKYSVLGATFKGFSKDLVNPIVDDEKDKRDKKKLEEELERYHEILEIIEDLEREYEKLGKLKDRAFGQSHLDYLDAETSKLAERMEAQKEYLKEIEDYLVKDREAIMKYGVSLDEYGRITNYEELVAAQVNAYNRNPTDGQEEYYNKFKDELDQYEETLNLLEEQREVYFDQQNERFDKSLEKAEYVVEYGTSLIEDSLSIIEYQLEKIEDKAYSTAEALALMGQKMNEVSKKSDIYKESIETTLAASGLSIDNILGASPEELAELVANGTFTADQVEQLRNYRDELLNTNQEMKDMANETLDKLLEGFDEWNEAIDKNKEKIDLLKEVTSSYRDIINLIGKDNLGVSNQMLKQMNEFNIAASQSQVDITRRQLEENKRSLEKAREEYRNAASEEEKYYWGQVVESLEETVMQGESDLLSATQDSLNIIQEAFKDTLTNITEEFEKAISGMYGSLEALQAAYDQRTDERERYLEDYAKIYELSKLTRDINKSMDESDSIRGKQRLLEIQEEINALQESGVEMTQFEVDELRARYELRLAEIALEEAQNAKSQVRMTRDSEGNWSYTYTADQDAIDSAQQNYEDKLYAYQNLTTEYIYDLESQIMEIPSQLSEALQAIWEDTTLTDEEKEARAQEAIDFYTQKDAFLKEQMEKAIGRSKELYDKDWKNYSNATGYKISADEEWIKSFDGTISSQITGFKTLEEYQQTFASSAMTMANDMRTAYQTMTSNIDKTLQNMGTSMTTFAQDLQGLMNTNKQKIEEYTKEVDDDIEKMGTSSADAMKKAADNWVLYADYVANSAGANEDLATALNNVIEAIGNLSAPLGILSEQYQKVEQDARAALQAAQDLANYGGPQINLTSGADSWAGGTFKGTIVNWEDPSRLLTSAGSQFIRVSGSGNHARYVRYSDAVDNGRLLGNKLQITENLTLFTLHNGHMVDKFDTGGYTGSWDSSGRLAMLHQKELVLNAEDTENFLAAVNIVRELSAAIDLKALAYQNALGQMSGAIRMSHEPQRLQQDVTIHAEFPNVTERNEIEAAFNSLMNQATQYVHRK